MTKQGWKALVGALLLVSGFNFAAAQFAPAAGLPGSTAIAKTDTGFVAWASGCTLQRGWQNIADTTLGYTTVGDENAATGRAGENGVLSLGDGGVATLTFDNPIINGTGFDFAVFENGFPTSGDSLAFLEFAFVEVSSDGEHFVRFPAQSNIQDTIQMAMEGINCALVNNLAGKYIAGYGTPFDLEELKDSANLNINHISHVRLVDVVGSIDSLYGTHDAYGQKINDPWPTPFPSSGFDLDAVGVLHADAPNALAEVGAFSIRLYPNPVLAGGQLQLLQEDRNATIVVMDVNGKEMLRANGGKRNVILSTTGLNAGLYFVLVETKSSLYTTKLLVL